MSLKNKALAGAAIALPLGALLLTPGAAFASSTGCAFTNGCATLHGVDAASHAVAMDSKYQSAATGNLIIGYPDNSGDGATDFDAVLHYTPGNNVTTYSDTALQANDLHFACTVGPLVTPVTNGNTITDGGNQLSVENDGGAVFTNDSGTTLGYTGSLTGVALDETASAGCTVVYTWTGSHFTSTFFADAGTIGESYIGGGVTQFSDTKSSGGGKFTFDTLPAGTSVTDSSTDGDLNALTSTAVPGNYSSVGVTYTEADGSAITYAFDLVVSGTSAVSPGAPTPYYTFAYAKAGVWSNECVTNTNGSGALTLETCTLGHDHYQDFYALQGGVPQGNLQTDTGGTYHIQNLLSAYGSANSCLIDPATVNPATPETNAFDEAIGGRQLRVDGSCTSDATSWSWSS